MNKNKPSYQPHRLKQFACWVRAMAWGKTKSWRQCRQAVLEAATNSPISDLQWHHLKVLVGPDIVEEFKQAVEEGGRYGAQTYQANDVRTEYPSGNVSRA